jgi:ribosomal-protein-alanine N-acetyltransferase
LSCLAKADINTLLDIETASFPAPWDRASFERELSEETSHCLVIKKGQLEKPDRVIAYLCFRLLEAEMYITNLAVDAAYRRRGVATFLPAIELYRKIGFCDAGRREGHYLETGEDAVVMIKEMTRRDS